MASDCTFLLWVPSICPLTCYTLPSWDINLVFSCSLAGCWCKACSWFSREIWGEISQGMWSQSYNSWQQFYFVSPIKWSQDKFQGLQFLAETNESAVSEKPTVNSEQNDLESPVKKVPTMKTKIHRSYPVGISWARDIYHRDWYIISCFLPHIINFVNRLYHLFDIWAIGILLVWVGQHDERFVFYISCFLVEVGVIEYCRGDYVQNKAQWSCWYLIR